MDPRPYPALDSGLVDLAVPSRRPAGLYELVGAELADREGETLWLDARNAAVTHALYEAAPSQRALEGLQIARAFTAYQHHALVRRAVRAAGSRTRLVVAPNVADLYRDDDVPDYDTDRLLGATVSTLAELGRTLDVPVLATTVLEDDLADRVGRAAVQTVECRDTSMGTAFETDEFATRVYWREGYWQTTIPYWVELLGAVDEPGAGVAAAPDGRAVDLEG